MAYFFSFRALFKKLVVELDYAQWICHAGNHIDARKECYYLQGGPPAEGKQFSLIILTVYLA